MSQPEPGRATPLWLDGWYQFAGRVPSPNFGPRPTDARVDLIVVHAISLPPGQFDGDAVQRLFTNTLDWNAHPYFKSIEGLQVSAHFFIRRNGDLCQFVSCDQRAWHAGASRYRGRDNCNNDSIGIELEGTDGGTFEEAQYETLTSICAAVLQNYPIAHLAGHEHVAPGRKNDPGDGFDWRYLQHSVGLSSDFFPDATDLHPKN
jgi:AmpD protein